MENEMPPQDNLLPSILRLPTELRLEIYRLLLLSNQTVRMMRPLPWYRADYSYVSHSNGLFPAILRTCRFIYSEAVCVLYQENVFRAHRIDNTNHKTALILRAKYLIGKVDPDNAEDDAFELTSFLKNHPKLEHLVLEFGFDLIADNELQTLVSNVLYSGSYSFRLTVLSEIKSEENSHHAAWLEGMFDTTTWLDTEQIPTGFQETNWQ